MSNHPRFTVSRVKIGDGPAEFEVQDGGRPLPWGEGVHPTREAAREHADRLEAAEGSSPAED